MRLLWVFFLINTSMNSQILSILFCFKWILYSFFAFNFNFQRNKPFNKSSEFDNNEWRKLNAASRTEISSSPFVNRFLLRLNTIEYELGRAVPVFLPSSAIWISDIGPHVYMCVYVCITCNFVCFECLKGTFMCWITVCMPCFFCWIIFHSAHD